MDRRTLVKMGALSPAIFASHPIRTYRAQFTVDHTVSAQMIITAHAKPKSAELWRRGWEQRAFEGEGEWYLQTSQRLDLPHHLAEMSGTLMYHTFVIGYAAAERSMLVGTFRREHIACAMRVMGDHQPEMIALAEWFVARPLPASWELMWSGAQLRGFVPTTNELGIPIEPSDGFWP